MDVREGLSETVGGSRPPDEAVAGLELRAVVKRYGEVEAVRGIDLKVARGEFLTILGPSGSGKTTILRMVSGFTGLTEGQIFLAGRDVSKMTPAERGIGMVFQNYALFPHLSAGENVAYGMKMRGWSKQARRARAEEVLGLVGLEGMYERLPREMSGGQQQRVALGRALAFGPELLLMDEPLGALDRELRIRMAGELRRIHAEFGSTVLYVTHDREEALTLSDRIAIMRHGELEAVDTPERLFTRSSSSFVASFFGGHNLLPATIVDDNATGDGSAPVKVKCLDQTATVAAGAPLEMGQQVALAVPTHAIEAVEPADNTLLLEVTVVESLYMGEVTQVLCLADGLQGTGSPVKANLPGHLTAGLTAGTKAKLYLDLSRCVAVPHSSGGMEEIQALEEEAAGM